MRLMVSSIDTLVTQRSPDVRRELITFLVYEGQKRKELCGNLLVLCKGDWGIGWIKDDDIEWMYGNASIMPEPVVHTWVLSHCSSRPICNSSFASVATNIFRTDLVCIPFSPLPVQGMRHVRLFKSSHFFLFFPVLVLFWQILYSEFWYRLGIIGDYFPFEREETLQKHVHEWSP